MGNQQSHYNKVSTGDNGFGSPIGQNDKSAGPPIEGDRNDLMFVFHNTEEDSSERVVHDQLPSQRESDDEVNYSVSCHSSEPLIQSIKQAKKYFEKKKEEIICERRVFTEPIPIQSLLNILQPGDLVEFCEKFKCHHWVIYVGNGNCVHQKLGAIKEESCVSVCDARMGRLVNDVYTFMSLPNMQVCSNAQSQVGRKSAWQSSESFAAWCRYGRPELTKEGSEVRVKDLDSNTPEHLSKKEYTLEIFENNTVSKTHKFLNLSDLISFRRKLERET